jgi:hypothetical protein
MSNKTITFTLTNGDGTINIAEDSILYMSENTDTVTGGYILSVDEKADREIIYIVDEDIATMEAAASKMFSVNLANEGQVMSLNANRCSVIDNLSGDALDLGITGNNTPGGGLAAGRLVDITRLPASHFDVLGVVPGDVLVIDGVDKYEIVSVGGNELFFTPEIVLAGSAAYSIERGGIENSKIYYRGLGIDFDVKEVTESLSEITNLINTL